MILKKMFSPGKIGSLTLKNRIILPAMCTVFADQGGYVSTKLINYHVARASGGCGMNIVEIAAVHPTSAVPKVLGIYDDKYLPGLEKLAKAIKDAGGKACLQLWHAGRQVNSIQTGVPIVAPSAIPCPLCQEMPKELTAEEIRELTAAYGDAALRARKAGFDAIELHGAHGYLINQFLSPYSNKRTDEYGGSFENRLRFALEILKDIRSKVGDDYPVLFRLGSEEKVEGGLTLEDAKAIAQSLEKAGVNAIHVSIGVYQTVFYTIPTIDMPIAFNVDAAAEVKSVVSLPVITVGRINDPLVAEKILEQGKADFISVGRGQIADPQFCSKAMDDDFDSIVKCIGCIQGCFDIIFGSGLTEPACCLLNPTVGFEEDIEFTKTAAPKRVLIAGGGPSGLEAAVLLRKKGHEVILCESESKLGGQFTIAGVAPRKEEFKKAAESLGKRAVKAGVDIRLQTLVTPQTIKEINPDFIIAATGSEPILPNIKGIDRSNVFTAHDILKGIKTVGDNVVVIGGGLVGLETAEFLAAQKKKVTVVEMLDDVAKDMGFIRKVVTSQHISNAGIKIITKAKCVELGDSEVVIEKDGNVERLQAVDSVVIAVGSRSNNKLEEYLKDSGYKYCVIGDAKSARKALNAIWEAAEIAKTL